MFLFYFLSFTISEPQNIVETDSNSFEFNDDYILLSNSHQIPINSNTIFRSTTNSVKIVNNTNKNVNFVIDFTCGTDVNLQFDDSFMNPNPQNSAILTFQILASNVGTINILSPLDPYSIQLHFMQKSNISFNVENEVVYNYLYFYDETEVILKGDKSLSSYFVVLLIQAKVTVYQVTGSSPTKTNSIIDCYYAICSGGIVSLNSLLILAMINVSPGTIVNVDSGYIFYAMCILSYNLNQTSKINAGKDEPNTIVFQYTPPKEEEEESLADYVNDTIDLYCSKTFICDLYMQVNHIILQSNYKPFDGSRPDSISLQCRETYENDDTDKQNKNICASISILKDDNIEEKEPPTQPDVNKDPGKYMIYETSKGDIAVIVVFSLLIVLGLLGGFFIYYKKIMTGNNDTSAPPP